MGEHSPAERTDSPTRPVAIIILTWNGLEYTKRCLETLRKNTDHPDYRIIAVDNGSTDGTQGCLEQQHDLTVVLNGANLGFAKGNNQGIAAADPAADVVLLNNDTEIHQPDWLSKLQEAAYSAPEIGLVGSAALRGPTERSNTPERSHAAGHDVGPATWRRGEGRQSIQ